MLGVPYDRITWMFKGPFGYINKTDLIGWGETNNVCIGEFLFLFHAFSLAPVRGMNNPQKFRADTVPQPFFRDVYDKIIISEDEMTEAASVFKNHAFIGYKSTKANDVMALDTCAGPHIGDQTISDYLVASIDDKKSITTNWYKGWTTTPADQKAITATTQGDGKGITNWSYVPHPDTIESTGGILSKLRRP